MANFGPEHVRPGISGLRKDAFTRAQARAHQTGLPLERSSDAIQLISDVRGVRADLAVPVFAELSDHSAVGVRVAVADALGRYSYSDVVDLLLGLLEDERATVRAAATRALGRLQSSRSIPLLERAARDSSPLVRRAVAGALRPLIAISPHTVVSCSTDLVRDTDLRTAAAAVGLLADVASRSPSKVAAAAAARALDAVREHHPLPRLLEEAGAHGSRTVSLPDWPAVLVATETPERGIAKVSTPPLDAGLAAARTTIEYRLPRHLYGWLSGTYRDGQFTPDRPSSITEDPHCSFRYSVAIATALGVDRPEVDWGSAPAGAADLVVALLADEKHVRVLGEPTRPIHVPDLGSSDAAHFTLQGVCAGTGRLDLFVYHRGSLIMRAHANVLVGEGLPTVLSQTAPILHPGPDLGEAIRATDEGLCASLLVERDQPSGTLLFVLFAERAGEVVFQSARVPIDGAVIEFRGVRRSLRELIGLKDGAFAGPAFQDDSPDLRDQPRVTEAALRILHDVAVKLENDLFGDRSAEQLRKALAASLRDGSSGSLQVISDDVFVPWQLLYMDDGEARIDPMRFWGKRFQLRQSTAKGSVPWRTGGSTGRPIAFVNQTLPSRTLAQHRGFLPTWIGTEVKVTEQDVLEDLLRPDNQRPACYFYCHAYSATDQDQSWIELRDGARLTLDQLKLTRVDPKTKDQIVFQGAPVVFLNACHSGQIESSFYRSFVGFFIHDKKAGAVIGTETEMPAYFATHFADRFWQELPKTAGSIGQLLLDLRRHYLMDLGNPLGLLYTLYANGDPPRA